MAHKRKTDLASKTWYRSERFMENNGRWFFVTREGTTQGPFDSRWDAEQMLEKYIEVEDSGMLTEDFSAELSMVPKD